MYLDILLGWLYIRVGTDQVLLLWWQHQEI